MLSYIDYKNREKQRNKEEWFQIDKEKFTSFETFLTYSYSDPFFLFKFSSNGSYIPSHIKEQCFDINFKNGKWDDPVFERKDIFSQYSFEKGELIYKREFFCNSCIDCTAEYRIIQKNGEPVKVEIRGEHKEKADLSNLKLDPAIYKSIRKGSNIFYFFYIDLIFKFFFRF